MALRIDPAQRSIRRGMLAQPPRALSVADRREAATGAGALVGDTMIERRRIGEHRADGVNG
jgi:hypothetical protein